MAVTRKFPAAIELTRLIEILNSLGAHLSAKLDHFATDERTLTDELCDMFYIWCQSNTHLRRPGSSGLVLEMEVSKTTQQEEAVVGADLGLHVHTPSGVKRALFQAKVFDPVDDRLRCDSSSGWDKLWSQLVLMQRRSPELAYLLIYVPRTHLDGRGYDFNTWEQGFGRGGGSGASSKFGITLIPVQDLIDAHSDWKWRPPVRHLGGGVVPAVGDIASTPGHRDARL